MQRDDHDLEVDESPREAPGTGLARVRAMSIALTDAARRTRLSSRRSRDLTSGGFEGRAGARTARLIVWTSFVAIFVIPTLAAIVYFGFVASDQYVAHAEFTVSAGESPLKDGVASFSGLPAQLIIQDTQIVTNFIQSREMVDKLEAMVGLRSIYSRSDADPLARFKRKAPVERLVKYWKKVATAAIKMPGGIVNLDVRAFSPQDAKTVADATLALCETLVNTLNARINNDAISLAEIGFARAAERLSKTLAAQEVARDESGILETRIYAEEMTQLIKQLRTSLIEMTGGYESALKSIGADAPQMRERKIRIDVMRQQIAALEAKLIPVQGATPAPEKLGDQSVSTAMVKSDALETEMKTDQQMYQNAAEALEHAKIAAEFKLIYFKVFVRPSLPEENEYPKRGLDIALVAVSCLAAWGLLLAIGSAVRNNMA